MRQLGNFVVPKGRDAVSIHSLGMGLLGTPVGLLGVLKSLPGSLVPRFVILFLMGFRGAAMRVGRAFVQLGSALMILVMRSVVITS